MLFGVTAKAQRLEGFSILDIVTQSGDPVYKYVLCKEVFRIVVEGLVSNGLVAFWGFTAKARRFFGL